MGRINGKRHIVFGFVAGKAEHHALVARALFLVETFPLGYSLINVLGLLAECGQHGAGVGVKTEGRVSEADVAHDLAGDIHDKMIAGLGSGRDFTRHDDHTGFDERFARYTAVRVLFE